MIISKRKVDQDHKPFIIAEMSGNHNQSIEYAFNIVDAAAKSGAHAIKLQTYTADAMTLDLDIGEFFIDNPNNIWKGQSLYSLYKKAYTPWDWHEPIMKRANDLGLICFSSPFDEKAVDFLEELNVPAYKIASFENTYHSLIKKIASTGKPIIVSTGMATISELDETVKIIRENGCNQLALLKCTSTYPAMPKNSNVNTLPHMRNLFNCQVGLSDHTKGIGAAIAAVAQGATLIEKHFTLKRSDGGVDAEFSLEPEEMKQLVIETENAWQSLGKITYGPSDVEKDSLTRRRSIYIAEDMKAGDKFTKNNLRVIRPGLGLPPKYYNIILGRRVAKDVNKGTAINWNLIK